MIVVHIRSRTLSFVLAASLFACGDDAGSSNEAPDDAKSAIDVGDPLTNDTSVDPVPSDAPAPGTDAPKSDVSKADALPSDASSSEVKSGDVICRVSNRTSWALGGGDCKAGTILKMGSSQFRCAQPLSKYGPLPIKVVWDFVATKNPDWGDQGALDLIDGCTGDSDPDTIDLIAYLPGDGATFGSSGGAAKLRAPPGPTNIQLTGVFECGPLAPGSAAHQDVWQFQGGNASANLAIVNGVSGSWADGTATCIGAGGAAFWSNTNDVDIYGGRYVTCNHGFLGTHQVPAGNVVNGAGFRTGRVESVAGGGDPRCVGYAGSNPCMDTSKFTFTDVLCQQWNASSNTWVNAIPGL